MKGSRGVLIWWLRYEDRLRERIIEISGEKSKWDDPIGDRNVFDLFEDSDD